MKGADGDGAGLGALVIGTGGGTGAGGFEAGTGTEAAGGAVDGGIKAGAMCVNVVDTEDGLVDDIFL